VCRSRLLGTSFPDRVESGCALLFSGARPYSLSLVDGLCERMSKSAQLVRELHFLKFATAFCKGRTLHATNWSMCCGRCEHRGVL
jgi:hypothetical protein